MSKTGLDSAPHMHSSAVGTALGHDLRDEAMGGPLPTTKSAT
jgi:hypothetical protein